MRRPGRFSLALALCTSTLIFAGCNSTLTEFRCEQTSDCSSEMVTARCEPSGHCSFLDPSCTSSGYRFGKSSGDESDSCVQVDDEPDPDAGVTINTPPIARIASPIAGNCGTSIEADGSASEAFDGATIETFSWTLIDGTGETITSLEGVASDALERGPHSLGGTYERPLVNFPTYDGYGAFEVDVVTAASEGLYQENIDLSSHEQLRLYFAVRTASMNGTAQNVRVEIFDNSGLVLFTTTLPVTAKFSGVDVGIPLNPKATDNATDSTLVFYPSTAGTLWFDNIGLRGTIDGDDVALLQNGAGETGEANPWLYATGGPGQGTVSVTKLPDSFRDREEYTLRLRVVDSRGVSSVTEEIVVLGTECIPPF